MGKVGGVAMALVAAWAAQRLLLHSLPPPFDDGVAVSIPDERIARLPGGAHGAQIPANFTGVLAPNERLREAQRLFKGRVLGTESVAVTSTGTLVMLDRQGFVFLATRGSSGDYLLEEKVAYVGPGRPLGFHVVGDDVVICDSLKGLTRLNLKTKALEVLSNAVHEDDGSLTPINYANDLDVAADGTVYFTSCTDHPVKLNAAGGYYDTMRSYLLSAVAGDASGKLLKFDPRTRKTTTLVDGLNYANGVALSADESFVAFADTVQARVFRHWLRGPQQGTTDVFVDQLPGHPDGISRRPGGGFWMALPVPLSPLYRLLAPYPTIRQLLSYVIIHAVPLIAKPWGAVVRLDEAGSIVEALYDTNGSHVFTVPAVTEHDGRLFLGNLVGDFVATVQVAT